MAQAMMTGIRGLEGALIPRVSSQKPSCRAPSVRVMATSESTTQSTRRAMIGLLATTVTLGTTANKALAEALPIKISQPPPTGKKATELPDEARDLELPLKERFYLQPLDAAQAAARAKQSAMDIMNVKELIDKKAWPYVQNDLRGKASYLRYDLNTVINSKPKDEKKALKELTAKLFETMDKLDFAARNKSPDSAEKYYSETVTALNDVLAKLG